MANKNLDTQKRVSENRNIQNGLKDRIHKERANNSEHGNFKNIDDDDDDFDNGARSSGRV